MIFALMSLKLFVLISMGGGTLTEPAKNRQTRHEQLMLSAQLALGALLAYWIGFRFTSLFLNIFQRLRFMVCIQLSD